MQEWVKQLQNKDPEAYRKLYDRFARPMYSVCLRLTGHADDAHDVLQESFIRIFEKIGQLRQAELLPAWVKRVCVNTSLQYMKERKNLRFEGLEGKPGMFNVQEESDVLNHADQEQLLDQIHDCIRLLPDRYRVVFTLHVLEEYSHEDIAKELGIVAGTSRSQYLRAKQKLIELIQKKQNYGGPSERLYTKV
ncbi:MAG: RNA polymerase sigma factor [Saprospiraceae bacterium]|nr:RNA polymerase sigma factor [Saprospiraceae bacterium]